MKDVQCYELFGVIALKNHTFSFSLLADFVFFMGDNQARLPVTSNDDYYDEYNLCD